MNKIDNRKESKIEYIHFMSLENLSALPGDPALLGIAVQRGSTLTLKTYAADSEDYVLPPRVGCIVETEQARPRVADARDLNDTNIKPRDLFLLNCVIRIDFFLQENFIKSFNYMEE